MNTVVKMIPISRIRPSPYQPRQVFDPQELQDLAESMKTGLRNPILVRPIKNSEQPLRAQGSGLRIQEAPSEPTAQSPEQDVWYELVDGERRWRATQLPILAWTEIKAVVEEMTEEEAALGVCVANAQRKNLNPIEQAHSYKRLADPPFNKTLEEIAKIVGKDITVVSRSIRYLNLPGEIQESLSRDKLSEGQMRYLVRIKDENRLIKLCRQADNKGWSVKKTEEEVNKELAKEDPTTQSAIRSPQPPHDRRSAPQSGGSEMPKDPVAEKWPQAMLDPAIAPNGTWYVSYGSYKLPGMKTAMGKGWHFFVQDRGMTPREDLKRWAQGIIDAIGDTTQEVAAAKKGMEAMAPANEAEGLQIIKELQNHRSPKNAQEQAEMEGEALKGPYELNGWVYGKDSLLAQKAKGFTWKDLGVQDPIAHCRLITESTQKERSSPE